MYIYIYIYYNANVYVCLSEGSSCDDPSRITSTVGASVRSRASAFCTWRGEGWNPGGIQEESKGMCPFFVKIKSHRDSPCGPLNVDMCTIEGSHDQIWDRPGLDATHQLFGSIVVSILDLPISLCMTSSWNPVVRSCAINTFVLEPTRPMNLSSRFIQYIVSAC